MNLSDDNVFMIAAHARSGSTYLCQLIDNIVDINVYLEIFHFKLDIIKTHLDDHYDLVAKELDLPSNDKEARAKLVHSNKEYLQVLKRLNPNKAIAFKVFPKHLPSHRLDEVIGGSKFIVVLRRNLLHSYISNTIANKLQNWGGVDTSQEKIYFSTCDFQKHVDVILEFYDSVSAFALKHNKKVMYLDHEKIVSLENPLELILPILDEGLNCKNKSNWTGIGIKRQDKRESATDKVINVDEMLAFIANNKLSLLADGKSSCELDEYRIIH